MMKSRPLLLAAAGLVVLALFPVLIENPYYIHLVETISIYAILLFGLDIVVGYTGQVSLGHAGLFGIGAYSAGVVIMHFPDTPFVLVPIIAIAVTALFGAVLALPALRVTGPYLAMVTLAFGTIIQILINEMDFLTNGPMGITLSKPIVLGHEMSDREFFWVVAFLLVAALLVVNRILRSHLGRAFEALRGSPVASDCMGVSVYRYKVYAFVVSAGLAGLAGSLYSYSEQYISPNTYNFELTVLFLLAIIMGGRKTRSGALLGATIIVMLPKLLDDIVLFRYVAVIFAALVLIGAAIFVAKGRSTLQRVAVPVVGTVALAGVSFVLTNITDWRLAIFGLITLLVVYYLQDGIVGFVRSTLGLHGHGRTDAEAAALLPSPVDAVSTSVAATATPAMQDLVAADKVLMQFGGLKALNDVDLHVSRGTIHGLIGPNGSGKSTMMNVLTGIYVPTEGAIAFKGHSIVGKTSARIALAGIARTFQNVQLFGEMTALQNVLVGLHHTYRSNLLDVALHLPRAPRACSAAMARAYALLEFVGLESLAGEEARNLPYGKQRLLEIARALALSPELLLLDEPAAGLTAPDIKELVVIIRKIREHGITLILIEHHMDVVMSVCDIVTVLDFGQKIAEGTPAAVQANPQVIKAYLGGELTAPTLPAAAAPQGGARIGSGSDPRSPGSLG
jgi:ABC-type branched-subunit amino acid transport system ATPase component/ABC-type branched-subunit amino acid transport system permease subunit